MIRSDMKNKYKKIEKREKRRRGPNEMLPKCVMPDFSQTKIYFLENPETQELLDQIAQFIKFSALDLELITQECRFLAIGMPAGFVERGERGPHHTYYAYD